MRPGGFSLSGMRALKEAELAGIRERLRHSRKRSRPHYRLTPQAEDGAGIIAEVKKASPSHGTIAKISPALQAGEYARGGAAAISVLIDHTYFAGSYEDLRDVASAVNLPVLCKEFNFFKEQLDLARILGADLALLIARMLSDEELAGLYTHAKDLGLEPLVEVHEFSELARVLRLDPSFLMVNARDLSTLELKPDEAIAALQTIPDRIATIYASGISSVQDIRMIRARTGARLFLIGTSIMEHDDPASFIRELVDAC